MSQLVRSAVRHNAWTYEKTGFHLYYVLKLKRSQDVVQYSQIPGRERRKSIKGAFYINFYI